MPGPSGSLDLCKNLIPMWHLLARGSCYKGSIPAECPSRRSSTFFTTQSEVFQLLMKRWQRWTCSTSAACHRLQRRIHPLSVGIGALKRINACSCSATIRRFSNELKTSDDLSRSRSIAKILSGTQSRIVRSALIR